MPIKNRDRFPNVDFLPLDQQKIIGDAEGIPLVLVGKEQGTDAPVVAKTYTSDFTAEDLHAVPAYELLNHAQGSITITEQ